MPACHSLNRVASRDPPRDPPAAHDREHAIGWLYEDLERATAMAFEKTNDIGDPMPDLAALAKLLELKAKVFGLLSSDGKAKGGDTVAVPLDEAEKLVKAAKLRLKETQE